LRYDASSKKFPIRHLACYIPFAAWISGIHCSIYSQRLEFLLNYQKG
jgi:hypothetical protein